MLLSLRKCAPSEQWLQLKGALCTCVCGVCVCMCVCEARGWAVESRLELSQRFVIRKFFLSQMDRFC